MSPQWRAIDSRAVDEPFRSYQSELEPLYRTKVYAWEIGLYLAHFDGLVSAFFNRDLAQAMAVAQRSAEAHPEELSTRYVVEDAIRRHCSCWDYLFQILVHFLGLQDGVLPQRRDKERLASMVMFDLDFPADHGITHVRQTPKDRQEALRAFRRIRKTVEFSDKGSRADRFFKRVRMQYAPSEWLSEVKRLLRTPSVREIHDLRNQITHAHPLTAQMYPSFDFGGVPGPGLSYRKPANVVSLMSTLNAAHSNLERAVRVARTAIVGFEVPNSKGNAGVRFEVDELACADCGERTFLPRLMPPSHNRFCRLCGANEDRLECTATTPVPQPVWFDMLRESTTDLQKLKSPPAK
ncbi:MULTISPECIES: hypothetical protein [unclassified Microbacterium]|uniref:hypothetical protein n=1 Tax=unclassified Microbacterium TaxID=2609290 RepID=UPI0011C49CC2|nr:MULTISPECIES: hypothetical protein [unclassified Microbacterium]MBT2484958.1 hypothetical protein [Microbacterium sp. ISL-108]